jgi:hypothetical protein
MMGGRGKGRNTEVGRQPLPIISVPVPLLLLESIEDE